MVTVNVMKLIRLNDLTIRLPEDFMYFVDLPIFQRLRHIGQLEFVSLAYPGASQNRFQHSLGTYYWGTEYMRILSENSPECPIDLSTQKSFLWACLFHDSGFIAFSHSFDRTLGKKMYPDAGKVKPHDLKRLEILEQLKLPLIERGFNPDTIKRIWMDEHYLSILLNGPVGVDRMDYIQRDLHYTGKTSLGLPPINRIIDYSYLRKVDYSYCVVYDSRLVPEIEQFLKMRQTMYTAVYFHHKSVSGSIEVDRLIHRLIEISDLEEKYRTEFLVLTDDYILNWIRFDPKLAELRASVDNLQLYRDQLPKRVEESWSAPLDFSPNWTSGPITGLVQEEFSGVKFQHQKRIVAPEVAFEYYGIKDTPIITIYRRYETPERSRLHPRY